MNKACIVYFATVVSCDDWPSVGSTFVEPMQHRDGTKVGKEPSYCCDKLKEALGASSLLRFGMKAIEFA